MAPRVLRPIRIEGNVAFVPLTHGYEAIIDVEDVPLVSEWVWSARITRRVDGEIRSVYAKRTDCAKALRRMILLHRTIMDAPDGTFVDHIDGDGLNNRRSNLRLATLQQNNQNARISIRNTSGVKGVSWDKRGQKWQAFIAADGKNRKIGSYDTIEAASSAYLAASVKMHGEFGRPR